MIAAPGRHCQPKDSSIRSRHSKAPRVIIAATDCCLPALKVPIQGDEFMTQIAATPTSGRRFRLILREGGAAREMGGDTSAVGVQIVDKIFSEALDAGASD